jgi:hypothetical protein
MKRRMLVVAVLSSVGIAGPVALANGATIGTVFGGVTAQEYPVVIQLSKTGRKVVRADIGLDIKCAMPPDIEIPDGVKNIPVSAAGKFTAEQAVARVPADPANGVPAIDVSAKLTGRVNKARTQITGTWQRKIVLYDPSDPTTTKVFDTCDTGVLRFTARN